jgi:hypothetical protein
MSLEEYARNTTAYTIDGQESWGQVMSCAIAQLTNSNRTRNFVFSVSIYGKTARFIRWDRSSAIISQAIDFTENPYLLALFLRSYSRATAQRRGWDTTATLASPSARKGALKILQLLCLICEVMLGEFSMEGNEPLTALLTGLGEIFFARYPVRRKGGFQRNQHYH